MAGEPIDYSANEFERRALIGYAPVYPDGSFSFKVPAGVPAELDHKLPADQRIRVPRITADTLGARPVDLAVIDGVETNRGGEGPWVRGVEPIVPTPT